MFKFYLVIIHILFSPMLLSQQYEIVWSEDFENAQLDEKVWNYEKASEKIMNNNFTPTEMKMPGLKMVFLY